MTAGIAVVPTERRFEPIFSQILLMNAKGSIPILGWWVRKIVIFADI